MIHYAKQIVLNNYTWMVRLVIALILAIPALGATADGIRFDFETGDLQGWQVMEGRFGRLVSNRDLCRNYPGTKLNKQGDYFLGTHELDDGGYDDGMTGVIESPVFILKSRQVSFLQGGGGHENTYVALCTEDGREVLRSKGNFDERFVPITWATDKLVGKRVYIKIVDMNAGPWGHVIFDDFNAEGVIDHEATSRLRESYPERKAAAFAYQKALEKKWADEGGSRMERLLSDDYLFKRGRTKVYKGDNLEAISIPIGGIGAGCIQMNGKAECAVWQIFNNMKYVSVPDSFFAVRVVASGGEPAVRTLQTSSVGPFAAMKSLEFSGEYPFAWYHFKDPELPVDIRMEAFSPFIPMNAKDSAIPCAIFNITAYNKSAGPVDISLLASQQNAVGYTGSESYIGRAYREYGRNVNEIIHEKGHTVLHMTAAIPESAPGYGDMALLAIADNALASADWSDIDRLYAAFRDRGEVIGAQHIGPSADGVTVNGAIGVPFTLNPGEKRTVSFVLSWYFPNAVHGEGAWGGSGNMYSNWWHSALDVSADVNDRFLELNRSTRLYHDTFYSSNLPHWLLDRITSQTAILRSMTCFWTRDGYFGGWEGCGSSAGSCPGNCTHVWQYAQAHARLFPEIGRLMREEELASIDENGALPHRQLPGIEQAADGQLGSILSAYREYLISGDREWLHGEWGHIRLMMENAISTWDGDRDGVLSGRQWNTLDEAISGSSSWIGSLYLAALAACEKMACVVGEPELARDWANIRQRGMAAQNETLYNGEYYIQIPEPKMGKDYGNGCHIDQVLGQWWANQLNLGWLYPQDRVSTALRSLLQYNFRPNFHGIVQAPRKFVDDDDSGMQMITWPKGGKPDPDHLIYYSDEVMSGFEYSAAAAMVQAGLLREGYAVVRSAYDRYDGRLRTGLTPGDWASWGYSGNPFGDDECGKFYARAMSVWSMLLASQGFIYDGDAGLIGFKPVWKPDDHKSFFTVGDGYGLFIQRRKSGKQTDRIELKSGSLKVKSLVFKISRDMHPSEVEVISSYGKSAADYSVVNGLLSITLNPCITMSQGDTLEVVINE